MSECELPEFYHAGYKTARKVHMCVECRSFIQPGEKYLFAQGRYSFGFASYKQHQLCAEACMFIRDHLNGSECIGFGELFDWMSNYDYFRDQKTDKDVVSIRGMLAKIKWRDYSEPKSSPA